MFHARLRENIRLRARAEGSAGGIKALWFPRSLMVSRCRGDRGLRFYTNPLTSVELKAISRTIPGT